MSIKKVLAFFIMPLVMLTGIVAAVRFFRRKKVRERQVFTRLLNEQTRLIKGALKKYD